MTTKNHARYYAKPSVFEELPHLFALADVVVSRAGAGVLSELAALKKPTIIIPLTGVAQNHQLRNAEFLADTKAAILLPQEEIARLPDLLEALLLDPVRCRTLGEALQMAFPPDAAKMIASILLAEISASPLQS